MYRSTHVNINLNNIEKNVLNILNQYPDYEYYIGVVKGNGYGHGLKIVDTLIKNGINYLAVSNLEEALEIRKKHKNIPILCLQPIEEQYLDICSNNHITITVHNLEYADKIKSVSVPLTTHIKIDSGMSRLGFDNKEQLKKAINLLKENDNITIEGIYTHMGTPGISDIYRKKQLETFEKITSLIDLHLFKIIHIDRSITTLCQEKIPYCNGVRLGIILYGYGQTKLKRTGISKIKYIIKKKIYHLPERNYDELNLLPAFSLYSKIIQVKKIKKGQLVGYGTGFQTERDMYVATAEIGYADGLNLNYNYNEVFINQKRYKIIGTINMGMISIAVDNTIKEGDIVEIFGQNISAKEVAKNSRTTVYQLLTCISNSVPRIYIKKEEK